MTIFPMKETDKYEQCTLYKIYLDGLPLPNVYKDLEEAMKMMRFLKSTFHFKFEVKPWPSNISLSDAGKSTQTNTLQ